MTGGRVVKRTALSLVAFGCLLLSFVAYQVWGTSIYEHHAQDQLRQEFSAKLGSDSPTLPSSGHPTATGGDVLANHALPITADPPVGDPVGLMSIPRIGMQGEAIIEGTGVPQLQRGPGHYPGTALPGQPGNASIAGHRTTYGAPFYHLDALQPGDPIYIQTTQGIFEYDVMYTHVVAPSNVNVLESTPLPELTLTTCNPRYSASQRLVAVALLKTAITAANLASTSPTTTTTPGSHHRQLRFAAEAGGGSDAVGAAVIWGAVTVAMAALVWLGWRRWRRPRGWIVLGVGIPATLGALLVCFAHVSLALPASF